MSATTAIHITVRVPLKIWRAAGADDDGDAGTGRSSRITSRAAPSLSDLHPDRRRAVAITGVVHLRTVGDHSERVHFRSQCHLAACWRNAVRNCGAAVMLNRHAHEKIYVR